MIQSGARQAQAYKRPDRPYRPKRASAPPQLPAPVGKSRTVVYAGAFAAVTIVGTLVGASLKGDQEQRTEKAKVRESTADQKIAMLENRRAVLLTQKAELDRKLERLRARMREEEGAAGRK